MDTDTDHDLIGHWQVSGKDLEKTTEANFRSSATPSIPKPLTSDMVRSLCHDDEEDNVDDHLDSSSSSS